MLEFSQFFKPESSSIIVVALALVSLLFFVFLRRNLRGKNLPRGYIGLPIIGESLSFLKAQREDRGTEWMNERIQKYGPIFKTSLMGSPTVVVTGQAGNKFIFGTDDTVLAAKQPPSISKIAGKYNLFETIGNRRKLLKGAIISFLKPESLRDYVGQMDDLVKNELKSEMKGKESIKAVPFMKKLTLNATCTLLFGLRDKPTKQALYEDLTIAFQGMKSIPINVPGTNFWRALRARSRIIRLILPIVQRRKRQILEGTLGPKSDVMSSLIALRDENQKPITDEAVMDNIITLLIASHDTTAILLSLLVWKLAKEPEIYNKVLQEQMQILRERQGAQEKLTWSEVQKMKYTWRVAQELMRIIPPVFGSFRKALVDTSFGGFDIPKGWQVFWEASNTHMNKEVFEDPTEFNPCRFENPAKPIPPFTYLAFGAGRHACIGNEFTRVQALTVIHNMVKNYEWSQMYPDESITRLPLPYPSLGLPINLKERNPHYI